MNLLLLLLSFLCCLTACSHRESGPSDPALVSLQTIDRNGFSETVSGKDRMERFAKTDFFAPQPYKKVLRVFGRNNTGKSSSKITSYHSNGQVWQYLEIVEGRANGAYKEWHPNGIVKIDAHVIEGLGDVSEVAQMSWLFDGTNTVWDEQGNKIAVFSYEKGVLEGTALYYHSNGQIAKSIPYLHDKAEGEVLIYDKEGNILEKIPFKEGNKHGIAEGKAFDKAWSYREEYDQGKLRQASYVCRAFANMPGVVDGEGYQATFKDGQLITLLEIHKGIVDGAVRAYRYDGSLKSLCHYHSEKKQGEDWEYYPTPPAADPLAIPSRPKILVNWQEDVLRGHAKTWYENGILESDREMNQNALHGLCSAYYRDGSLMLVEEYQRGRLTKGSYFKKGDKKPVSQVEEGRGIATLHTSDGLFLRKTNYEKGMPLLHD